MSAAAPFSDGGEPLGAAHAAEPGGDDEPAGERSAEVAAGDRGERLVRALDDALRADVDPAARRHLAEHGEPAVLEVAEVLPGGPRRDEKAVGDEHARCAGVRAEDADRLAGLNEQRFVALERRQRPDDGVERRPAARRASRSAVDDQILRPFGDVGIEIVHQHPERRFLRPAFAGERGAARGANRPCGDGHYVDAGDATQPTNAHQRKNRN